MVEGPFTKAEAAEICGCAPLAGTDEMDATTFLELEDGLRHIGQALSSPFAPTSVDGSV